MEPKRNKQEGIGQRGPAAARGLNRVGIKLALATGLPLCLFAVAALTNFLEMRRVEDQVRLIAEVKEPASAAANEIEINAVETGMGVLMYLDTRDPAYRQQVIGDDADFQRFEAQFDRLVQTPQGQELGRQVDRLYHEYKTLGIGLMAQRDQEHTLFTAAAVNLETLDAVLDNKLLPEIDSRGPDGQEKILTTVALEAHAAEVGNGLGSYLGTRDAEYLERLSYDADEFRQELARLNRLALSVDERTLALEVEAHFNRTWSLAQELVTLRDGMDRDLAGFLALRSQLDRLLDEEIQIRVGQDLTQATREADEVIRRTYCTVLALLLAGLAAGAVAVVAITRSVIRPVGRLAAASRLVAAGDLSQRVEVRNGDELGFLGAAFNDMIARRQEAETALLQVHQEMELRVEERTSELAQANNALSAISETVQAISATLHIDEVYERFAQEAKKVVDFDRITINSIDRDSNTFTFTYVHGISAPGFNAGDQLPLTGTQTEELLRTGQSQVRPNIADAPDFRGSHRLLQLGLHSSIIVPLWVKGQVIGSLSLQSSHAGTYGPREQKLLERLAVHLASTVSNAQLYQALEARTAELARANQVITNISEIARIITSTLDIDQVYEQFAQKAKSLVDFDRMSINMVNLDRGTFTLQYMAGLTARGYHRGDQKPLAGSQIEKVMLTGRSQVRDESTAGSNVNDVPEMVRHGIRSSVLVPLVAKGEVIGSLGLWSSRPGAYGATEQEVLERLASQIAPTVSNAQLYHVLEERTSELARANQVITNINEVAQIITSTLDIDQVYEAFVQKAKSLVDFDRMSINVVNRDDGTFTFKYVSGLSAPGRDRGDRMPLAGSQVEAATLARRSQLRDDSTAGSGVNTVPEMVSSGVRSAILVPMFLKGEVIGGLGLWSRRPGTYGVAEQEILELLAGQIASTVENAQLFEEIQRESQRAASALAQLQVVLEAVDTGIILVGEDNHTVLWANRKLAELIGAGDLTPLFGSPSAEEEMVRLLRPLLERPEEFFAEIERIYQDRSYVGVTGIIQLGGLHKRAVRQFTAPVRKDDGEYLGRLWVITDVTDQQRLEAQNLQSQKMDTVGRLAGGVAHDFNNLLTAILGYTQLGIAGLPEDHPSAAHFQEVEKAAQRAATLTRQLLAFSRHQAVEATLVDLNQLVMGMHGLLRRLIGESVELVTLPDPALPAVKADHGQMEQVVMNLVVNARDAMPEGGRITIQTTSVTLDHSAAMTIPGALPGRYALLTIADTGSGMTLDVQAHLFEPFFTTKELGKGTGLGLATCHGIVRNAGGHIQVDSELWRGTTFKVYLPAAASGAAAGPGTHDGEDLPRGTETVLVADDEPAVRAIVAQTLGELGYTVLEARDGEEARRISNSQEGATIHLLLTDVVIPKLGGVELASQFKAQHPEARVLFVSGYTEDPYLATTAGRPDIEFMQKPFLPAALARRVRQLLDREAARHPLGPG